MFGGYDVDLEGFEYVRRVEILGAALGIEDAASRESGMDVCVLIREVLRKFVCGG